MEGGGAAAGEEAGTSQRGGVEDVREGGGGGGGEAEEVGNLVVEKARKLMDAITYEPDRPNAKLIHALASILEKEEAKYMDETGQTSVATAPPSHTIGQLGTLLRDNDEFFELISSKFVTERQYPTSVKAASVRLLISCSQTWMFPHIFEDSLVTNVKRWAIEDSDRLDCDACNWTNFFGRKMPTDAELLKTYSTGLLAVCLVGDGGQTIEDVLTSGIPAKLMHYLRTRVLEDDNLPGEDVSRTSGCIIDGQHLRTGSSVRAEASEVNMDGDCQGFGKGHNSRYISKSEPGESLEKQNIKEQANDTRHSPLPSTATTYTGHARNKRDKKCPQNLGTMKNKSKELNPGIGDKDNYDCFKDCRVGSRDISDVVIKAVKSAATEARATNAPEEAVRAAVDAAAEAVKTAALEELERSNDEEAAVKAAAEAACTIIDAANVVELSRLSNPLEVPDTNTAEPDITELIEDLFIRDLDDLALLREKFCIQCLEVLGEYVEVLGPVVHEKGVDVCIELLLRCSVPNEKATYSRMLPDVLRLICALCAHRKFAAMFVDRDGIQKLLAVSRVDLTLVDLSSCLFTIGSLQGIMERVCALPSGVVHQVVKLAIQLLECSHDQARKNASLFLNAAFVFQSILDSFDSHDGLQKLLGVLYDAASVRSGPNSGVLGLSGAFRNDRSPSDVLTSSEKQIAFHTCVALRQYFRAHLLLLVESVRPSKINRALARTAHNIRAPNKPLDISNEAMDAIFVQLQKDRKLGSAFVRAKWLAVERFLSFGGHNIMLELCQAPPDERYLRDLVQYALGVLHIITLVPYSRKLIVNTTLSNDRVGVAVILDAANIGNWVEPEIIESALCVLVNLVCPPPSISNKPALVQQSTSVHTSNAVGVESRERNVEKNVASQHEVRERNIDSMVDRGTPQTPTASGLVGDRRISLGSGAGGAGLAAQLEQGYRQARESVRANNGIKILLTLLQARSVVPPASLDCLRALACRVLLGLARDDAIAHILTKLQVGKKLSELIRDIGNQTPGTEQGRWQAELTKAAIELITIVTNSGRSSTLVASDAATPTLRRIERAAIAAATPISYEPRELLLLMHEHLMAYGLDATAASLLKEAQLRPLPSLTAPSSFPQHISTFDTLSLQLQWPCGRSASGFLADKPMAAEDDDSGVKPDSAVSYKKRSLVFSSSLSFRKSQPRSHADNLQLDKNTLSSVNHSSKPEITPESPSVSKKPEDTDSQFRTPVTLPMKRKMSESGESGFGSVGKRLNTGDRGIPSPFFATPNLAHKIGLSSHGTGLSNPSSYSRYHMRSGGALYTSDDTQYINGQSTPFQSRHPGDLQLVNGERFTLDSIMVQHLKNQHRQCSAPITTLPPLSLLHPHVCPEPRQSLNAPLNVTARLERREFQGTYGDSYGNRRDRQFIYSRFRPWRTCRDDLGDLLTCITFLGDSHRFAAGTHNGELKIFDTGSSNVIDSSTHHQANLTHLESHLHSDTQLILSSTPRDVCLWDASSVTEPKHQFGECKAARFSNSGSMFAALSTDQTRREVLLYDIQTSELRQNFMDTAVGSSNKRHGHSFIHFSPEDTMLLWNGTLWDLRTSGVVKRFEQLSDYGGGGFHPAGNEVIINSEVWDIRNFKLLRSVPSLDQTVIAFNPSGNVIYAILRRNLEDITSAMNNRRVKDPLFAAFRTVDAVNYSDIATVPVDRCVLDFAVEPTDSVVGLVTMDDQDEMFSSARVFEIGRRRPMDDDSDPDDDADTDDEEEDSESDEDLDIEDPVLGTALLEAGHDSDEDDVMSDDDSLNDMDDYGDEAEVDGVLEIVSSGEDDDMNNDSDDESYGSSDGDDDDNDAETYLSL